VDGELKRLIEEETEKRFNRVMSRLQETLEKLHGSLPPEQRDSALELKRLLKEKKIEQFSQFAKSLDNESSGSPEVQELIDRLTSLAKQLSPDKGEVMTPGTMERFPSLAQREKELQEKTDALGETLERLSQLFPGMDTEIIDDLRDGAASMGRASGKLDGEDASGAIPPEQDAIRALSRSQQALQQMAQQMACACKPIDGDIPGAMIQGLGGIMAPPSACPPCPSLKSRGGGKGAIRGLTGRSSILHPRMLTRLPRP
jgi:hypothetical protein